MALLLLSLLGTTRAPMRPAPSTTAAWNACLTGCGKHVSAIQHVPPSMTLGMAPSVALGMAPSMRPGTRSLLATEGTVPYLLFASYSGNMPGEGSTMPSTPELVSLPSLNA